MTVVNNTYQKSQPGFTAKEQAFFDRINHVYRLTQLLVTPPFQPYAHFQIGELQNLTLQGLLYRMNISQQSVQHLTNVHNTLHEIMTAVKSNSKTFTHQRMQEIMVDYQPFEMVTLEECFQKLNAKFVLSMTSAQNLLTAAVERNNLQESKSEWNVAFNMNLSFEENTVRQLEATKDFLVKLFRELQEFYRDTMTAEFYDEYEATFR